MISLKNTLLAIKGKIDVLQKNTWYLSDLAKSDNISGKVGIGYSVTITWTNIPSNATNIKFIPTFMRWVTPLQTNNITKSGTNVTANVECACVVSTGVGCLGGVLMYQLS